MSPFGVRTFPLLPELFQLVFQFRQPPFLPGRGKGGVLHLQGELALKVLEQAFHLLPQGGCLLLRSGHRQGRGKGEQQERRTQWQEDLHGHVIREGLSPVGAIARIAGQQFVELARKGRPCGIQ